MGRKIQDSRRNRFGQKEDLSKPLEAVDAKYYGLTEPILEELCSYAISDNITIHRIAVKKLKEVTDMLTEKNFKSQTMLLKFNFLKDALALRLKYYGLDQKSLLSMLDRTIDIEPIKPFLHTISDDTIIALEATIQNVCDNITMENYALKIRDTFDNYLDSDFRIKNRMLNPVMNLVSTFNNDMRKNKFDTDSASTLFRLSNIKDSLYDVHRYITSPSYKLKTGMIGLNRMLGGGFEKGRVYCFFGLPGDGKTVTLINLLYQIWKYNADFKTSDPTKKPCIVFLTMENFVIEIVCALYHIITRGKELKFCASAEEALEEFKKCQFEYGNGNPIEIVIKFKPVNSVNTDYLYQLNDELKDEGFESICFIQDYLMRIKPSVWTKDTYQDYGTVVNDFKTFSTLENLTVITASQLNRNAVKTADENRGKEIHNSLSHINRSDFGDSINIERNLDGSFIILKELYVDGKGFVHQFIGIKMTKHRYPIDEKTTDQLIYQPYYDSSQIAFVEDIGEIKPLYRTSLDKNVEIAMGFNTDIQTVPNSEDLIQNNVQPVEQASLSNVPDQSIPKIDEIDVKFSQIVEDEEISHQGLVVYEQVPAHLKNISDKEYQEYINLVVSHMTRDEL